MIRQLIVGVGVGSAARDQDVIAAVETVAHDHGLDLAEIGVVTTWDRHRDHPAVTALAARLHARLDLVATEELIGQKVDRPSARVAHLTAVQSDAGPAGLVSVAEAAVRAIGGAILVPKQSLSTCTVVIGRLPARVDSVGLDSVGVDSAPGTAAAVGHRDRVDEVHSREQVDRSALAHHGDSDAAPGLHDFAVNVAVSAPPAWLAKRLAAALPTLAAYPVEAPVRRRVADALGLSAEGVVLVNGAAESFALIARSRRWRRPLVVHPQFTEPEAALRAAGHDVVRHVLDARDGFTLHARDVDPDADLVIVGNPTNPTSRLHDRRELTALARPGRTLVIDEAFMDVVPGESGSLLPILRERGNGVLVIRSLTKTFGLAGIRAGFVAGDPRLIERLRAVQPPWSVNSLALAAVEASFEPDARDHVDETTTRIATDRAYLVRALTEAGLEVVPDPRAPFVLARHPQAEIVRTQLRRRGFAVRRGDTFPGLCDEWLRVAVREPSLAGALAAEVADILRSLDHELDLDHGLDQDDARFAHGHHQDPEQSQDPDRDHDHRVAHPHRDDGRLRSAQETR